jgi:acyl carrier protein
MTDIREIQDQIRTFLLESFLTEAGAETLRDDDDLLQLLDSLQVLRMVIAFEGAFGIKVEDGDLTPENLGSVRKVAALIARKRGEDRHSLPDGPRPGPGVVDQRRPSRTAGG